MKINSQVYVTGSIEAAQLYCKALDPCDWNPYCANVIDKFGVFWWIAI